MKKLHITCTFIICMVATLPAFAQWELFGNNISSTDWFGAGSGSDIPLSFEHRYNHDDGYMIWSTTVGITQERMRLTRPGWLGLNTTTPQMRFHVLDGGILATGDQGTNTVTGAGTRLMWIPDRAAFRAGRLDIGGTANFWDAANVGVGSAAFGTNNRAAGEDSFAQGENNNVDGECSTAFGGGNIISQQLSFAFGRENHILMNQSISLGFRNEINATSSILMGTNLRSNAAGSTTIGSGVDGNDRLTNTEDNSIMLGTLSDVPTVFVSPSNGVGTFGNVGIGNITAPTEVLDVNGTARLRVMPESSTPNVLITGVQVDDEGDYQLNHLDFNGSATQFLNGQGNWVSGTNVCEWDITSQNLTMGYSGACNTGNVGIGRAAPARKLDVLVGDPSLIGGNNDIAAIRAVNSFPTTSTGRNAGVMGVSAELNPEGNIHTNIGGYFAGANATMAGASTANYGVIAIANDQGPAWNQARFSYGVRAYASRANYVYGVFSTATKGDLWNVGVYGDASSPSAGTTNIGVYGKATGNTGTTGHNIGVYGHASGSPLNHAGYFAGSIVDMQSPLNPSDEMLKENIEVYGGGLSIINQLAPKQYNYKLNEYGHLGLPEGSQIGFIAQDIAEILPELTQTVVSPPQIDSLGVEIAPSVEFTAMSYTALIPILVSAVKEQQSIIENQNDALAQMMEQLATMQQQINQCCNASDGSKSMPGGTFQPQDLNNQKSLDGGNELYQNIPNPFRESTTISYSLEEGGRVQLSIYDKTGKVIATLTDAHQGPGRYSEVWNANGMPSGVYHYALYVNGELLVKRAIKLQE